MSAHGVTHETPPKRQFTTETLDMVKHILVAVGTGLNETALQAGIARAKAHGARLTALHVVEDMPWWAVAAASHDFGHTLAAVADHSRAVVAHCEERVARAGIDAKMHTVTLPPHGMTVAQAIAKAASDLGADLIVVGAGRQARWWFFEESVVKGLKRHTQSEILVATEQDLPMPRHLGIPVAPLL
jgi:nucleotide-binding universal stress UspA family protein